MEYRKVGKWGLKISELSLGSWLTFGRQLEVDDAMNAIREAFKRGINFFDTAEVYTSGMAESVMGQVLREFSRDDIVVSTKIFWGGEGPNKKGLSRKHLLEGTWNSLKRLQLDYVDLLYCHRSDPDTPIEETVLAMDYLVRNGYAMYWGTSEWSAEELENAHKACDQLNCMHPVVEQPQYNMLIRGKVEKDYLPIYEKYGMGLTTWSPLASGILTGKYSNGIPKGSRMDKFPGLKKHLEEMGTWTESNLEKVKELEKIAVNLGIKLSELALAWTLKNTNVSSVILGISSIEQLEENLKSVEIKEKLTEDVMNEIGKILV